MMANEPQHPTVSKYQVLKNRTVRFNCPRCNELLNTMLMDAGKVDACPSCATRFQSPGSRELQGIRQQTKNAAAATVSPMERSPAKAPTSGRTSEKTLPKPPKIGSSVATEQKTQAEEVWNNLNSSTSQFSGDSIYSTDGISSNQQVRESPSLAATDSFLDDIPPLPAMEQVSRASFSQKTARLGKEVLSELVPMGAVPQDLREIIRPKDPIYFADHPSSTVLYIGLALIVVAFIPIYILFGFIGFLGGSGYVLCLFTNGVAAIVNAFFCYASYLKWKHTYYLVSASQIAIRSGVFNRKIKLAQIDQIQEICIDSGIVDRWLDLNTVHVSTAASTGWRRGGITFRSVDSRQVLAALNKSSQ